MTKPVVLAANKVDNPKSWEDIYDFYSLGFGDPMPISGVHGLGLGDLLDKVVEKFPKTDEKTDNDDIRFSIIGRPKRWEIFHWLTPFLG